MNDKNRPISDAFSYYRGGMTVFTASLPVPAIAHDRLRQHTGAKNEKSGKGRNRPFVFWFLGRRRTA